MEVFSRIRRTNFFIHLGILLTWYTIIISIMLSFDSQYADDENYGDFCRFILIATSPLLFILVAKRLHDINVSGWLSILLLIPYLNFLFILIGFVDGSIGDNKYGKDPKGRTMDDFKDQSISPDNIDVIKNRGKEIFDKTESLISTNYSNIKKNTDIRIARTNLFGANWLLLNDDESNETLYIFRTNDDLVISKNGLVHKNKFEFITDNNSLLITDENNITELFNIVNIKDDILIINRKSNGSFFYFINGTKIKDYVKSELLNKLRNEYSNS